jgi:hypothetical protein
MGIADAIAQVVHLRACLNHRVFDFRNLPTLTFSASSVPAQSRIGADNAAACDTWRPQDG